MSLNGRVFVITGGGVGFGRALAKELYHVGAKLVTCSLHKNSVQDAEIPSASMWLHKKADVRIEADMEDLANFAVERFGRIDVWVNNAGIWIPPVETLELSGLSLRRLLNTNFLGVVFGSKAALRVMKKQKNGFIVSVSSAFKTKKYMGGYVASKMAVEGFMDCLIQELNGSGVSGLVWRMTGMKTELFGSHRTKVYEDYTDPVVFAREAVEKMEVEFDW